jgi:hypothetical protein
MASFEHSRISMIVAAVALAIVSTPLAGVVLARTNVEAVVSPASHAQRASGKGSETWVGSQSHVAHPHPQHSGHQKKRYCQKLWIGSSSHAATFSLLPSTSSPFTNFAPALTRATK